jgi:enolase-phosphatase E1
VGPIAAVLTDIEGTTTPIAFVRDTLFPFARERLPAFLSEHQHAPEVAAELAKVRRQAPDAAPLDTLLRWMDQDAKATPLKALQGMIWQHGYDSGQLLGAMYPDVAPCLQAWAGGGLRLLVYSSGSAAAQRQIFGRSVAGDLASLFSGFFDTNMGPKREADSYDRIAIAAGVPASALLFLSDVEAELDAAAAAGLRTCQVVRADDGTIASTGHSTAADFWAVARQFGLPAPSI